MAMLCFSLLVWSAGGASATENVVLDDFETLNGWTVATSQGAHAELVQDGGRNGKGMRLNFDFQGGAGSLIVRKNFSISLPENYAFTFHIRAVAPASNVEFKLFDPSGENVWWRRCYDLRFPTEWQEYRVKTRMLEFAWGPSGGAAPKQVGAVEFAMNSSASGKGSVWIDDFRFERRERANAHDLAPQVTASTSIEGQSPQGVIDDKPQTHWKSGTLAERQWLLIDFLKVREYGGLVIDWDKEDYANGYQVQISQDGARWQPLYTVTAGNGRRDPIYLPDTESRYLRLELRKSSRGQGYGINSVAVKPVEFSSSANHFFESVARDAPRGAYPRYFAGEQSYFTVVGSNGGAEMEGLLNTDGALEVGKGAFSIEPFLYTGGRLVTWNDVEPAQELERGYLPIPSVRWRYHDLGLNVTAFSTGEGESSVLYARYRVENAGIVRVRASLMLALRPFQVNPPWQSLNMLGGTTPIRSIRAEGRAIRVDARTLIPLTPPTHFGAAIYDQGAITDLD